MKKTLLSLTVLCASISLHAQTLVTFFTTEGNFEVEIYDDQAPITGGNFLDLVEDKFYDGIIFHRVIDGFMIQGGDPTGLGSGGPGYSIDDEFIQGLSNVQKTISMANAGPNTGGSQFFINLVHNTYLDYDQAPLTSQHAVFGKVTEKFSVVVGIGNVAVDGNDRPLTDVVMDSVRIGSLELLTLPEVSDNFIEMNLSPNPVNHLSTLNVKASKDESMTLTITDLLGRQILNKSIDIQNGVNQISLSELLSNTLASGYYTLGITNAEKNSKNINFVIK